MRLETTIVFGVVVGLGMGLGGCSDPSACQNDSDCFEDQRCRDGRCVNRATPPDAARRDGSNDSDARVSPDSDLPDVRPGTDTRSDADPNVQPDATPSDAPDGGSCSEASSLRPCRKRDAECKKTSETYSTQAMGCIASDQITGKAKETFCFCSIEVRDKHDIRFNPEERKTECMGPWRKADVRLDTTIDFHTCDTSRFALLSVDNDQIADNGPCPDTRKRLRGGGWIRCERNQKKTEIVVHWVPGDASSLPLFVQASEAIPATTYTVQTLVKFP